MPLNTNIYPPAWTDICPGTQVQESNVTDELQRQIRVLRNQLQLRQKAHGRSIAELQNQSITVANPLFPATTVGRHFLGGGEFLGLFNDISRFNHYTEQLSTTGLNLNVPGARKAGTASVARGYWCGGVSSDWVTSQNIIEAVVFQTEAIGSVSATLAVATNYARGGFSQTKGYIFGNDTTAPGWRKIEALTFAGETVANLGNLLINAAGAAGLVQSSTKIYVASGWSGTRTFDAFTTSSETVAALAAQLSVARHSPMHCFSTTKGYVVGGWGATSPTTNSLTVDALTFSSEAVATLANTLSLFPEADAEGASAARRGYMWGGVFQYGRRDVQSLLFSSERMISLGAILKRTGRYCVPVGQA